MIYQIWLLVKPDEEMLNRTSAVNRPLSIFFLYINVIFDNKNFQIIKKKIKIQLQFKMKNLTLKLSLRKLLKQSSRFEWN